MVHDTIRKLATQYNVDLHLPVAAQGIDYPLLGQVKPRHAQDIAASSWTVGCETLDRDFADYEAYKPFLGPLGAKSIRVQTGWAKTEKQPGVYDFVWLDALVDDALAQGVQPWLQTNYGNPIYPGGGTIGLGGGLPTSDEALAGWDNWVRALVMHFADRVNTWEIWNEADISKFSSAAVENYLNLFLHTATIIREVQPQSVIYALSMSHDMVYAETFLQRLKDMGKLGLVDAITLHGYPRNPDKLTNFDALQAVLDRIGTDIVIHQGETGCPSRWQTTQALNSLAWTEDIQAKWDLRRMLAHHGRGIPYNLFSMSDQHYRDVEGNVHMNYMGMVATNEDKSVHHLKPMYFAAQTVFAIFDNRLMVCTEMPFSTTAIRALAVHTWADEHGAHVTAYWFNDAPPDEANGVSHMTLHLAAGSFTEPVLVDVKSGCVYALPANSWSQDDEGVHFTDLPVYDAPLLIAERNLLEMEKA